MVVARILIRKKGILPQENVNGYIVAVKLRFGVDILISKSERKKKKDTVIVFIIIKIN